MELTCTRPCQLEFELYVEKSQEYLENSDEGGSGRHDHTQLRRGMGWKVRKMLITNSGGGYWWPEMLD